MNDDFFNLVGTKAKRKWGGNAPPCEEAASSTPTTTTVTPTDAGPLPRWAKNDDTLWPASETCEELPPGFYRFDQIANIGACLRKVRISIDSLIRLPDTATSEVLAEFATFWRLKDRFVSHGFLHKRGILLWGPPGCLAADTHIHYQVSLDGKPTSMKNMTIERLYQLFHGLIDPGKERYHTLADGAEIHLSSVDDEGRIISNKVCNVVKSGIKSVYRVLTTSGLMILATKDHRFRSNGNYVPLRELNVGANVDVHTSTAVKFCYVNYARHRGMDQNLFFVSTSAEIKSIEFVGEQETYDVEMNAPYHNFVANGFIVHNSGKTASLMLMGQDIVEHHGGIVCLIDHPGLASICLGFIRKIEPDRPIVALIEDLDALVERCGENQFLSLLDGEAQVDRIVFVATTNYPERLDRRFVDRPSRFDTIRWIGMPSAAARRVYLQTREPTLTDSELTQWVNLTEGFSVAHLRELVILVKCFDRPLNTAIARLEAMRLRQPKSNDAPDKPIFGIVGSGMSNGAGYENEQQTAGVGESGESVFAPKAD